MGLPFEYHPRWVDLASLAASDPAGFAQQMEIRDRELEDYLGKPVATPTGGLPDGGAFLFSGDDSDVVVDPGTPYDLTIFSPDTATRWLVWGSFYIDNPSTIGAEISGAVQFGNGTTFGGDQVFDVASSATYINVACTGLVDLDGTNSIELRFINYGSQSYYVQGTVTYLNINHPVIL